MFYKKAVKKFCNTLRKKNLCWSLLLLKLQAFTRNIWETYFKELLRRATSENYFIDISMHLKSSSGINICYALSKGGSRTVAASKIEHFVISVTIITKRSILEIRLCFCYRYILKKKKKIFFLSCVNYRDFWFSQWLKIIKYSQFWLFA